MIQQAETLIEYGYLPMDLLHGSDKPILATCDNCKKVRIVRLADYRSLCHPCTMKGKKHTEETKALMSAAHKGRTFTEEHKANMSAALKGKNAGINHPWYEKHLPKKTRQKISESHKGQYPNNETRQKMSAAHKGKYCGENSPSWKGGISFEPYCVKFNNAFKEYIRAKFAYTCFLCPVTQVENGKKLAVHHVNYNKNCGCDGDKTCNFVPLCKICHSKTNYNRDYWQKLITDKLHNTIIGWDV